MLQGCLDQGAGELYLVIAEILSWNTKSIRMVERLGFTRTGEFVNGFGETVFSYAWIRSEKTNSSEN
jgi:RimJ/RimL family protein N-acetyltransferase